MHLLLKQVYHCHINLNKKNGMRCALTWLFLSHLTHCNLCLFLKTWLDWPGSLLDSSFSHPLPFPWLFWNIDTLQGKPRQTGVRGHKWEWTWLQLPRRNQSHHRQHERNLTLTLRGASWGQQILPISHTRVRLIYNEDLQLELSAYKSTNK